MHTYIMIAKCDLNGDTRLYNGNECIVSKSMEDVQLLTRWLELVKLIMKAVVNTLIAGTCITFLLSIILVISLHASWCNPGVSLKSSHQCFVSRCINDVFFCRECTGIN